MIQDSASVISLTGFMNHIHLVIEDFVLATAFLVSVSPHDGKGSLGFTLRGHCIQCMICGSAGSR